MKGISLLLLTALIFTSCRSLPVINPVLPPAGMKEVVCPAPFLKESVRLIHAIEFRLAGENRGAVIGITVADPATRSVSCAIMTVEGLVLFEAESFPSLKVKRALAPFNTEDFARNMINDIRLIFFTPEGDIQERGTLSDGAHTCRWREKGGARIDVVARQPAGIEINKYKECGYRQRRIRLNGPEGNIYQRIELAAEETFNYSLLMTLIEAVPLAGEQNREKTGNAK
ncbi:MAG TPA: hypothetical protein PK114_00525 [Smithellaceae bacterium]|nr:hypothetical protein [Smithellaceae bacterium]